MYPRCAGLLVAHLRILPPLQDYVITNSSSKVVHLLLTSMCLKMLHLNRTLLNKFESLMQGILKLQSRERLNLMI